MMTPQKIGKKTGRICMLALAAFSLAGCDVYNELFGDDPRLGDEAEDICIGRVRATLTYEQYQELENAAGNWVPAYTYDITLLDLEAIQELIATGADDTVGTRLMQQTNNPGVAVERFKLMKVDRKGALFLGRNPALYRVSGRAQPASTILTSGCNAQRTDTRLIDVTWKRSGGSSTPRADPGPGREPELDVADIPNLGGVR